MRMYWEARLMMQLRQLAQFADTLFHLGVSASSNLENQRDDKRQAHEKPERNRGSRAESFTVEVEQRGKAPMQSKATAREEKIVQVE